MIILDPLIRIVIIALDIYIWMVIISAILSWLVHFGVLNTRNQGGIDISPIILILVIYFAQMVLSNILFSLHGRGF